MAELIVSEEEPRDRVGGYLMVGVNDDGEVVINLDHDRTGHINFSPRQARQLAALLNKKASEAERYVAIDAPSRPAR